MVNSEISIYVQNNIIPCYSQFDDAHNIDHVEKIIKNSLRIASEYDVNIDMVYVIAAYHDVGLKNSRENHEKTSAAFLLDDIKLKDWFSGHEIEIMVEAIEDHRASNDNVPRSIYGKIISEADRDIEYETIIKRVIQYSLANYPNYDFKQHFSRSYEHLEEKYGKSGYLKLWLDTEQNRNQLEKLRNKIANKHELEIDFKELFYDLLNHEQNECTKNI